MEEGKLRFNDPVSRFIPAFNASSVAVPESAQPTSTPGNRAGDEKRRVRIVPAFREITIRDLLTHRSGLLSRGGAQAVEVASRNPAETLADYIPGLATVPLDFSAGHRLELQPRRGHRRARARGRGGVGTALRPVPLASNHVGELYAEGCVHQTLGPCDFYDQRGMGFGLTVDVVRDHVAAGLGVSNGSFGWAGAHGTRFWVDPKEQLVTILMVATRVVAVHRDFEYAVRQALVE